MKHIIIFAILFFAFSSSAIKIRFPSEELASETVLPIFQPKRMVLDRRVTLKKRVEIGATLSIGLDEPFYFPFYGTGLLSFYFSELHGVSVTGTYFYPKKSGASEALSRGEGLKAGARFDVFKAPYPQMMNFLNYQFNPFYGKISLSKILDLNLSIYTYAGPGLIVFNDGNMVPAANIGIGQKLYFNKWVALRGDFGAYGYYGPAVARIPLGSNVREIAYIDIQDVQKSPIVRFVASIGLVVLL